MADNFSVEHITFPVTGVTATIKSGGSNENHVSKISFTVQGKVSEIARVIMLGNERPLTLTVTSPQGVFHFKEEEAEPCPSS